MSSIDFCFAWSWPYDADFAARLAAACLTKQITFAEITPNNLHFALEQIALRELSLGAFFDRASDAEPSFQPIVDWVCQQELLYINRNWLARRSWDKASMHAQITRSGLDAPYTLILPPYLTSPELPILDLSPLGAEFAIKPAHGGAGQGVILGARSWEEIMLVRQQFPEDQYLLQAQITPAALNDRPAWFRIIYCTEKLFPCWWDPTTHIYTSLSQVDIEKYGLEPLIEIIQRIARLSQLELFSSEVALVEEGRFLVVDYINDPIDLRPQSKTPQGVPDEIIDAIANNLADYAENYLIKKQYDKQT